MIAADQTFQESGTKSWNFMTGSHLAPQGFCQRHVPYCMSQLRLLTPPLNCATESWSRVHDFLSAADFSLCLEF